MIGRALMLSLLVIALIIGAVAGAAYFSGEPEPLPFEYDGFD